MGWLNFGGKKRKQAQGFGNSKPAKSRKRPKTFILEKIVTPSAGVGGLLQDFDALHQLLGALSLSDLDLPNFFADSGVCPIDPNGAPTNNLPPLIDFDPLGLYHDGIATQTPYNPGGAFETLPVAVIPVDPHSPNPNNPNAIRQLLDSPLASQPLVASIDTGVSADSPYLNYANIKKGRDYVGGDDNPLLKPGEGSEHGTFMLGIIDAINKTAPKWVGRAIDSGRWADSLVEFVDAAKASGQKNAIANLSLDLTQKNADGIVETRYELTPPERSAIEYARQNGVMLVVAAGNDGGVMSVLGQASQEFDNIFTVGAGDINGRSIYSSYGRGLDIVADGGTNEHPALSTVGNDLGTMAGTSVATAKVAGAASLVWAANPALNYRQVMEILEKTARDLGTPGRDDETGFGFLNTLAAVELAKKTKPEVYNPIDFGTPTTWGGEGKVTPMERAVNITNENFSAWVVSSNGITLRNSPNTSDRSNFVVKTGDTLTFDGWTYGEQLSDLTTGEADALWYRFRYNGGTYWVPSAWTGGYPGSRPPLLPPAQAPAQQYQQPPVSQQPTNNTVYLSTNAGEILQVDESTGASHKIYQGRAFTDLAVAPNGKLYGCTFYDGLYEINPSTGAERYVGPLAGGSLNSLTFSADGRLYGADQGNGNLFQISPDNGQMNLIGNLGGPSSGDLVFNGANEILATVSSPNTSLNDRLVAVNLATGNSRYIGDLGLLEVYGLSWENGQLTAYTSDRRKLAIDPNTAKATVVGTVSSNGLIWGAATKPATASSPTDDVRQKFLYAASLYPQVGAAITGMQDQGGGVFRQEFERAIMIWNGQQVTVYETKGRSASTTSPSSTPQVNNPSGFNPVVFTRSVGVDTNYGIRLRTDTNLNAPGESVTHDSQIEFDGWKYGEPVQDRTVANGQMDALWYRIKGTNYWIPSAFINGYPPGYKPPVSSGGNNGNTGGGNNNNTLPVQPADFTKALAFNLLWEGGYSNHPSDPGGATNKGITQNTYNAYRSSKGLSTQDVRGITDGEVQDIYYTNYWIASGSDQLTSRLAMVNFDTAVNMGVGAASGLLQQARQSANGDEMSVVRRYLDLREARYRAIVASNPSMGVFLNGWLNRLNSLRAEVGATGISKDPAINDDSSNNEVDDEYVEEYVEDNRGESVKDWSRERKLNGVVDHIKEYVIEYVKGLGEDALNDIIKSFNDIIDDIKKLHNIDGWQALQALQALGIKIFDFVAAKVLGRTPLGRAVLAVSRGKSPTEMLSEIVGFLQNPDFGKLWNEANKLLEDGTKLLGDLWNSINKLTGDAQNLINTLDNAETEADLDKKGEKFVEASASPLLGLLASLIIGQVGSKFAGSGWSQKLNKQNQDKRTKKVKKSPERINFDRYVRPLFWKNEAEKNTAKYSAENLARMRKGLSAKDANGNSLELHHKTPLGKGGTNDFENLEIMTREDHRYGDNYNKNHPKN